MFFGWNYHIINKNYYTLNYIPNPKFNNAFYISFGADENVSDPTRQSYYSEKKGSHPALNENGFISFATKYPRKLIPSTNIPKCRINFAFDGSNERFNSELDIESDRTNTVVGEEILEKFLKKVTPYSAIYILSHGGASYYLSQTILMPGF